MAAPDIATLPPRPSRARYLMLALIFIATVINYVDRTNLSVAAPLLSKELRLDHVQMGLLFSAFAWTYAAFNLPGGVIVDRLGSRLAYGLSLLVWSAATFTQGLTGSFAALFGLRLAVGVAEAPAFPSNNRVVTLWFPTRQRGMATSCFVTGQYIGTALFTPGLFWIASACGWRSVFYVTGAVGLAFAVVWWAAYRDPLACRRANAAEIAEIRAGGALVDGGGKTVLRWSDIRQLFRHRQIWALCLGKFAISCSLFFFLTWFPSYLVEERGLTLLKAGGMAMLPYLAASIGVLAGGAWSDALLKRGCSLTLARKAPIVAGFLFATTIFLANFTRSDILAIAILSFAFFAQGVSSMSWAIVSEVAPKELVGVTGGVVNFAGNLAGIATPIAIGFIIKATGSYYWALALVAAAGLVGAFAYVVVLGEVKRIELNR